MEMRSVHSLLEQTQKISTDIRPIDTCLNGGIAVGRITEIVGTPGTGKTEICLKLCLNVQIPQDVGGLEGKALFIDTRKDFNPARLQEMAMDLEKRFHHTAIDFNATNMLKNVYYVHCLNAGHLVANILNLTNYLTVQSKIKLIVVDSLSFAIRMLESVSERTALLMELHDYMHRMLLNSNVAIVITNEFGYHRHKRHWQLKPILGQKHMHLINERIWLTENEFFLGKTLNTRRLIAKNYSHI